ncbi:MAG TPA: OsmC family protein [Solirubrobacteraceae bacterium]|nr:OsmC family protein [Solirubrobacteraceae bacterium]
MRADHIGPIALEPAYRPEPPREPAACCPGPSARQPRFPLWAGRPIGCVSVERDKLRALQAPLKARYLAEPGAAQVTLSATGAIGDGISCSVQTGRVLSEAGLHPASGGDGSLLCSGDMLLEALVACAGVTLRAVATSLGIVVTAGHVRAEGDLDFRGTLGVDREAPVGFSAIRLSFELKTDAAEEQLATLQRLTERYCVVYQTLASAPGLTTAITQA